LTSHTAVQPDETQNHIKRMSARSFTWRVMPLQFISLD
jgi:hypothetical protein